MVLNQAGSHRPTGRPRNWLGWLRAHHADIVIAFDLIGPVTAAGLDLYQKS